LTVTEQSRTVVWDLPLRIWHWAFALGIVGLLYTGLSGDIALLETHQQLGYCMLGLLLFRVGWGFWGGRYARYSFYGISPRGMWVHFRGGIPAAGKPQACLGAVPRPHTEPGAAIAVVFVALVGLQVVTGLFATDDIFTEGPLTGYVAPDTAGAMTWLHHRIFWLVVATIATHLVAHLVYASRRDSTPLAMFTGRKSVGLLPTRDRLLVGAMTAALAGVVVWGFLALV